MLENSFSYIPVYMKKCDTEKEEWYVISDYDIVDYLKLATSRNKRKELLSRTLEQAIVGHKT